MNPAPPRPATSSDITAFLALAAEVEHWFGPMVAEPGFHAALRSHIAEGAALLVEDADGPLGGILLGPGGEGTPHHLHWLVVAARARGTGVGRELMAEALRRFGPGSVEVVTFGADHPGAGESGARAFYRRLGFVPAEAAEPGPEGGSRQVFRRE
ncbi:GNAT family N-acetyltransferase [Streptomyces sp. NPDC001054]